MVADEEVRVPAPAAPGPADIQPVAHESLDRTLTGLVTALPIVALGVAVWFSWEGLLHPSDVAVFGILYVLTGLGVSRRARRPAQPSRRPRRRSPRLAWDVVGVSPERQRRKLEQPGR